MKKQYNSQIYNTTYQLKLPLEIEKIIEISDPVHIFHINRNLSALNKFMDIKDDSMWYFADVMESANTHIAVMHTDGETWVK